MRDAAPAQREIGDRGHAVTMLVWTQSGAIRALRWLLVALALALAILSLGSPLKSLEEPFVYRKDFIQEYVLAKAILAKDNPYLPSAHVRELASRYVAGYSDPLGPDPPEHHPSAHPPTMGILALPLSALSYPSAALAWMLSEMLSLVVTIALLARAAGLRIHPGVAGGIAVAVLAWYPLAIELSLGQLTLLQLLFLAGAVLALGHQRRASAAGVMAGLGLVIKPSLWPILLVFPLHRKWHAFTASIATLLAVWSITIWIVGIDAVASYFLQVLPVIGDGYKAQAWNISLGSIGWKLFQGTGSAMALGQSAPPLTESALAAQLLSVALPAAALLVGCYYAWRLPGTAWALGLMICIGILVSPIAWSFYLILALIPIALVVEWLAQHRFPVQETNAALVVAILLLLPPEAWAVLLTPTLGPLVAATMGDPAPIVQVVAHLGPAVALVALAALVAALGMRAHR